MRDWAFKFFCPGPPPASKIIAISSSTEVHELQDKLFRQAARLAGVSHLKPETYPEALAFQEVPGADTGAVSSASTESLDISYLLEKVPRLIGEGEKCELRPEFRKTVDFDTCTITLMVVVEPEYESCVQKRILTPALTAQQHSQPQQSSAAQARGSGKQGSSAAKATDSLQLRQAADPDKPMFYEKLLDVLYRDKDAFEGLLARSAAAASQKAAQVAAARAACKEGESRDKASSKASTQFRAGQRASASKDTLFFFQPKHLNGRRDERVLQEMMIKVATQRFNASKGRIRTEALTYGEGVVWTNEWVGNHGRGAWSQHMPPSKRLALCHHNWLRPFNTASCATHACT